MAFDGSGVFNRLYSWVQDAANGINITASRVDEETSGIVTGLNQVVSGSQPLAGPVRGADGTEAAPGHSFKDETSTGMYRPSFNKLALAVAGSKHVEYSADLTTFFEAVKFKKGFTVEPTEKEGVRADLGLGSAATTASDDYVKVANVTAAGFALLDDADAAAQLVTLGAAPLDSPSFTGTPAAPTAAAGTNTTQLSTTAFVKAHAQPIATNSSGVGNVQPLAAATGASLSLPAGGSWFYFILRIFNSELTAVDVSVAAGGTEIQVASAGVTPYAFAWRIA
jgi:hypothetical protein